MRFLRGLCVALALLGWIGFSAAMAAQIAAMSTLTGGLVAGAVAFVIPPIAIFMEIGSKSGGCVLFATTIVWVICATLATSALLVTTMWLFWAVGLTLALILAWLYCGATLYTVLSGK